MSRDSAALNQQVWDVPRDTPFRTSLKLTMSTTATFHESAVEEVAREAAGTSDEDFRSEHPQRLLQFVLPLYVMVLLAYTHSVAWAVGCPWWSMLAYYWAFMLAFYLWHYQAHNRVAWLPFNAACRAFHHVHHWTNFPPDHFFGTVQFWEKKRGQRVGRWWDALPLASSAAHEALLYVQLALILGASHALGVGGGTLAGAALQAVLIGYLGNVLHNSFHNRATSWRRFRWWRELRALHYHHHTGSARHNYAMANFLLDVFFGSFYESGAARNAAATLN